MRLIKHHSSPQGGDCIEVATAKTRILLDLGNSIAPANKTVEELRALHFLPDIQGLYKTEEKTINAIMLSHAYVNYSLLNYLHPDIPIYMSQAVYELINISRIISGNRAEGLNCAPIKPKRAFAIGDITIGPYVVDAGASDAVVFLITAEKKKIFYSSDPRGHKDSSSLSALMRAKAPSDLDCLLMDISTRDEAQQYCDEASIERRIIEILCSAQNITFLFANAFNIARLVSAYRACVRTNKLFVIDLFSAYILDKLRTVDKSVPEFNWRNVRIKFDAQQAETMNVYGLNKLLYFYNSKKIDAFDISRKKNQALVLVAHNIKFSRLVKDIGDIAGARAVYSDPGAQISDEFKQYCIEKQIEIEFLDSTGLPSKEDAQAFAASLNPKTLVPTRGKDAVQAGSLFKNIKILDDKEIFEI